MVCGVGVKSFTAGSNPSKNMYVDLLCCVNAAASATS